MSKPEQTGFDLASANRFNLKYHERVGWRDNLPPEVAREYAALTFDPKSNDSALTAISIAVHRYQCAHGFDLEDRDGKLGRGTFEHMWSTYRPASGVRDLIVNGVGRVVPELRKERQSTLIDFRDPGGIDGRAMGFGSSSKRKRIRHGVIHWGSTSPLKVAKVLASKGTSTHFAVEHDKIFQLLDLWRIGWHAAAKSDIEGALGNFESVGLDITQQPETKWLDHFLERGFEVEIIDNPAMWNDGGELKTRGKSKVLSLDPRTVVAVAECMVDVSNVLGFPCRVPRGEDGLADEGPLFHGVIPESAQPEFRGWCCHANISRSKWDASCWLPAIAEELFKANTNTLRDKYRLRA